MHSIYRENIKNIFEYSNERTQTTLNEYNFTIYNRKDLYDIK